MILMSGNARYTETSLLFIVFDKCNILFIILIIRIIAIYVSNVDWLPLSRW